MRSLPGVKDAGGVMSLPVSGRGMTISFDIEGRNIPQRSQPSADFYIATPHYFETVEMPLLRGRTFNEQDQRSSTKVVIINQSFANKYFPNEDPVGKHIKPGANDEPGETPWREIVGIVGDIRSRSLGTPASAAYYVPLSQMVFGEPTVLVRTIGNPSTALNGVRDVLRQMDPEVPLYDVRTYDDYIALSVGREKFQTILLGIFAGLALLLTAVGLYGVIAYSVVQRTQEIGIRMALGASAHSVLVMVLKYAAFLAGTGIAAGLVGSIVLTRFMSSMLFGIAAHDPLTIAAVCVVLAAVALLASYIPARRATKVDPMVALRYE
ncbi:MAG: FtsX-like permease family protein [Terriglobales bacterium]